MNRKEDRLLEIYKLEKRQEKIILALFTFGGSGVAALIATLLDTLFAADPSLMVIMTVGFFILTFVFLITYLMQSRVERFRLLRSDKIDDSNFISNDDIELRLKREKRNLELKIAELLDIADILSHTPKLNQETYNAFLKMVKDIEPPVSVIGRMPSYELLQVRTYSMGLELNSRNYNSISIDQPSQNSKIKSDNPDSKATSNNPPHEIGQRIALEQQSEAPTQEVSEEEKKRGLGGKRHP